MRIPAFIAFLSTIVVANWLISHYGPVSVGFGLMAPAGVFAAGLAFTFRDFLHDLGGRKWVIAAVILGAALSYFIEDVNKIAIASGVAFLCSEFLDFLIYTPLREKHWPAAVLVSNTAGLVLDSFLFLWLAFGSLDFFWGQVVGKFYMTIPFVVAIYFYRRAVLSRLASS
jgi:uncharacterized PurR-regulated membrane protein YhhQ (DUF165 family)